MWRMLAIGMLAAILVVGGYILNEYQSMQSWLITPKGEGAEVTVDLPPGTSVRGALKILVAKNLIVDSSYIRYVGKVGESVAAVQAGEYVLSPKQSPLDLLRAMAQGKVKSYSFTIPEGLRIDEIAVSLQEQGIVTAAEFLRAVSDPKLLQQRNVKSLEGYLFPDTYTIKKGINADQIVRLMLDNFDKQVTPELLKQAERKGMTPYQMLVAASIIEKESGGPEEYPLVGSVIHNRLRLGMLLQMDPTVIYGVKNFDGNLTRKHLQTDHPWNTYTRKGLPPTPICNPGLGAIKGAANPPQTKYLYFVSMNNGHHTFSKSLAEHARAVRKYQVQGKVGP